MREEALPGLGGDWQLALLAIGALLLLATCIWCATRLVGWGWPWLIRARDRLVDWARPKPRNPVALLVVSLLDPARPESAGLLAAALLVLGGGWALFGLLEDVLENDPLVLLDHAVFSTLQGLRTGWLDHAMVAVTELGSAPVIVPVVLAVGVLLAWKRCWRTLGYWVATILFGRALVWVLKTSVQRTRPNQSLYDGVVDQFSFPSGHAASSIVLYGFLAFLLARGRPRAQVIAIGLASAAIILLTSFSRLYLGAHWMSDVLGSLALGTAWVALASVAFSWHAGREAVPQRALAFVTVATLAIAGTAYIAFAHDNDMQRYAVQAHAPLVPLADWHKDGWRRLPAYRIDLEREPRQPMTLQWAAPAERVQQALLAAGWQPAAPLGLQSAAAMLASQPDIVALPLQPEFHNGELPALRFVRSANPGQRLVLRLWATTYSASAADDAAPQVPLWVGSVEQQMLHRFGGLVSWAETNPGALPNAASLETQVGSLAAATRTEPASGRALWLLQ